MGAEAIVPTPKDAAVHFETHNPNMQKKNNVMFEIQGLRGKDAERKY